MEEIVVTDNSISTTFQGGITYTADGLNKYKENYLKQCFATAIAFASKRWQLEEMLNNHLNLNGKIE